MVPFLYWAVARRSPGPWQIIGAVIATVGLTALSLQGDFSIRWGDALTLLGSFLYALHILGTGFFAPRVQPATLAVTQMVVSTADARGRHARSSCTSPLDLPWQVWAAVVWTALSGTIYAFFIQSWAQRYTTSTHAAILLGFESVFAALTGVLVGMDAVTWRLLVGGSLMLSGVFIVELLPASKGVVEEIEAEEGTGRRRDRRVSARPGHFEARRRMCVSPPPARLTINTSAPSSSLMTQRTSWVFSPHTRILSPSSRAGKGTSDMP